MCGALAAVCWFHPSLCFAHTGTHIHSHACTLTGTHTHTQSLYCLKRNCFVTWFFSFLLISFYRLIFFLRNIISLLPSDLAETSFIFLSPLSACFEILRQNILSQHKIVITINFIVMGNHDFFNAHDFKWIFNCYFYFNLNVWEQLTVILSWLSLSQ